MENERRYRRRNSDVKEENMESSEQEPRTVRHEYGSSSAGDSIGQARRVIDELEARINDARRKGRGQHLQPGLRAGGQDALRRGGGAFPQRQRAGGTQRQSADPGEQPAAGQIKLGGVTDE